MRRETLLLLSGAALLALVAWNYRESRREWRELREVTRRGHDRTEARG